MADLAPMEFIWMLWVGFGLLSLGILMSVWEEWPRQGIGDTSYLSLSLWILGTAGIIVWALFVRSWTLVAMGLVPMGFFVYWVIHKISMRLRTVGTNAFAFFRRPPMKR